MSPQDNFMRHFPTSAIQTQYRRYADVQKTPKLPLLEGRAMPGSRGNTGKHMSQILTERLPPCIRMRQHPQHPDQLLKPE